MFSGALKAGVAAAAALGALLAFQLPTQANSAVEATYAAVGAETSVPYGWVDFCERYQGECDGERLSALDINLSAKAMSEIVKVNKWVNAHVEAVSDADHWNLADRWDYPNDGKGDCEDYALMKRQRLMRAGWPASALLMTVVFDEKNEGHAILMARTVHGDMILDNKNDDLKFWYEAPYHYVMRESFVDPRVWMTLDPDTATPTIAVAGNRKPPGVDEVPACRPRSGWCAVTVKNP